MGPVIIYHLGEGAQWFLGLNLADPPIKCYFIALIPPHNYKQLL